MTKRKNYNLKISFGMLVLSILQAGCSASGKDLQAKYDVCFAKDYPGATSRVIAYTPVRCSDRKVVLGDAIDAEYGELKFADVDADGVSEIIVESSEFRCRWSADECMGPSKTTVKVSGDRSIPVFTIIGFEKREPTAVAAVKAQAQRWKNVLIAQRS